jgi:hypothetical protein
MRIGIILVMVITAIMLSLSVAAEDAIKYPADADTDLEKRELLEEAKEGLRIWHNEQTAGMTAAEARAFFVNEFLPKSKAVEAEINRYQEFYRDSEGRYIKNTPAVTPKWNPDIGWLLNSVSTDTVGKKGG